MPLILLAEEETATIDHVRSALASQGWLVKTVGTRDQALRAASEFAPQLVLVNDRLAGAEDLVRTFSKGSGGPGVVLLTATNGDGSDLGTDSESVDAVLAKPLDTAQLIEAIRYGLSNGKGKPAAIPPTGNDKVFSSEEIFGDLLDDILDPGQEKAAVAQAAPAQSRPVDTSPPPHRPTPETVESKAPAAPPPVPPDAAAEDASPVIDIAEPVAAAAEDQPESDEVPVTGLEDLEEVVREEVAAWADTVHPEDGFVVADENDMSALEEVREASELDLAEPEPAEPAEDLDSRLEDTLAGVLAASLSSAAADAATEESASDDADGVDALLSQALGDLDLGTPSQPTDIDDAQSAELDNQLAALTASLEIDQSPVTSNEESLEEVAAAGEGELHEEDAEEAEIEVQSDLELVEIDPLEGLEDLALEPDPEPATESVAPPSAAVQGIEFGEYTLEQQIGVGGMASVWKARRKGVEGFEKRVAIKKILPQAAENEDFVEMFIDEAKLAAQLNHNNITHIYDLGKIDDDYFIAMELVEGKNLRQILDLTRKEEKAIPVGVALFIAAQIADGLDYAHHSKDFDDAELGLVHRDVSPQNVLISFSGDIKLCDFGIAKAVSKISTTQMGALKGKLQYMSPEQAWGKAIDHRSDIFSLGTLLYEMLTGERLFTGDSEMAVLESVRQADVGAQIIQSPSIPAGVRGLLLRALSKEAEDRFESAAELQRGLEELLKDESPTPGAKAVSAFVHDLLGLHSAPVEAVEAPEEEPAAGMEVSEDIDENLEWDAVGSEEDPEASDEKSRWLRRLLTRLLPVILVIAIGGGVVAGLMQRDTPSSSASSELERVAAVSKSSSSQPATISEEPTAVDPQGQPPPADAATTSAPAPPLKSVPQEQEPTPKRESAPKAREVSPVSEPSGDEDLERRVEAELQRVQELMAAPGRAVNEGSEAESAEAEGAARESAATLDEEQPAPGDSQLDSEVTPVEIVEPGPGVVEPQIVDFRQPAYTPAAEEAGVEGTVRVSVLVDETGKAADVQLIAGLPEKLGLEEAVIESARNAVYKPATKDGKPARMWHEIAILFELP